jgi:sarcosine oxidase subunit beta
VLVLDKGATAYEASSRATGYLSLRGETPEECPLAQVAERVWGGLDEELGYPTEWTQKGRLWAAISLREFDELKVTFSSFQRTDIGFEFIDAKTCRTLIPALTEATLGGIYTTRAGHANPQRTSQAFAWAFRDLGGEIREYTPVLSVLHNNGSVTGVRTSAGDISAGAVALCAAAHNALLLKPFGIAFPVAPVRLEALVTTPVPPLFDQACIANGLAIRQTGRGNIHANGGPHEWIDVDGYAEPAKPNTPLVRNIARRLFEVFPVLKGAQMLRAWAGIVDVTPDQMTIIHAFETPRGLIATSASGHGFGIAPAMGIAVSDLALHGRTELPIDSLTLDRFSSLPPDWRRAWNWQAGSYNT